MQMNDIKKGNQRFYIGESENETVAEITWVPSGENLIIIDHTHVAKDLEGQGIGKKLVDKVAHMAREEGLKIIPTCSFAKSVLEGNEKYKSLLESYGSHY